jgi:hypothetical protein
MPLNPTRVFESRQAAQYTGQNSADFASEISDFTVVSENAQGLTFTSGGEQYTVAPNGYVAWYQGTVSDVFQNEDDYRDTYADLNTEISMNHVHDITTSTGRQA